MANNRRAVLLLCFAIVYLVWGSSYLVTRIGVQELPPFLFGGVRFVIGGLLLFGIARLLPQRGARLSRVEWRHIFVVGFFTVLISHGFNAWALQWVPSNQAALLNVSAAFWIALLGASGKRAHPVTGLVAIGLLIGFVGVALVMWPDRSAASSTMIVSPYGSLVPQLGILLGCFGWAVGTIYMRKAEPQLDLLTFTGLQMFAGGILMLGLAYATGQLGGWRWSTPGLLALGYMTLFSSCLAYTAYAWLSQNASPVQVGTYSFVNPAIATLLGWLFLSERLNAAQIIGMVVLLAGMLLVSWPQRPTAAAADGSA